MSTESSTSPQKRKRLSLCSSIKDSLSKLRAKVGHSWNSSTFRRCISFGVDPNRKPNRTDLSHKQLMSLLISSTVEDPDLRIKFLEAEKSLRAKPDGPYISMLHGNDVDVDDFVVSRTPLWVVTKCFSAIDYHVGTVKDIDLLGRACTGAFIISGVINPDGITSRDKEPGSHNRHQPVVPHVPVPNGRNNVDGVLETVIVYLPSTGTFFTRFAPALSSKGDAFSKYRPLPSSALRIRLDGSVALGGFLSSITQCISVSPKQSKHPMHGQVLWSVPTHRAHEVPDTETKIIPNFLHQNATGYPITSLAFAELAMEERRLLWWKALISSNTYKTRCKCYARGMLFSTPSVEEQNCFIVDTGTMLDGDEVSIRVISHLRSMQRIQDHSTIKIRRVACTNDKNNQFFVAAQKMQKHLSNSKSSAKVRRDDPGNGLFYGFGNHVHNGTLREFNGTQRCKDKAGLSEFMKEMRKVLRREFPLELATIVSTWEGVGCSPPVSMGGSDGVSLALNASLNLANAPHYDTNDMGICSTIWTEDVPGQATQWNFVMPNLVVNVGGRTYHGVMVRLSHGAAMTWDSSCLRHCTSITNTGTGNNVYGFNVTNNVGTLSYYERLHQTNNPQV
jgi:hypothetical protein